MRCGFQLSDAAGEPVWHPCPHIDPGIDPSGKGALNIPERIIEQYFVAAYVNADGRHAGKASPERRGQWMFRVGGLEVGIHEFRDLRAGEEGIGFRTRLIARAREC